MRMRMCPLRHARLTAARVRECVVSAMHGAPSACVLQSALRILAILYLARPRHPYVPSAPRHRHAARCDLLQQEIERLSRRVNSTSSGGSNLGSGGSNVGSGGSNVGSGGNGGSNIGSGVTCLPTCNIRSPTASTAREVEARDDQDPCRREPSRTEDERQVRNSLTSCLVVSVGGSGVAATSPEGVARHQSSAEGKSAADRMPQGCRNAADDEAQFRHDGEGEFRHDTSALVAESTSWKVNGRGNESSSRPPPPHPICSGAVP